jgi:hexosaminidase
MLMYTLAVMSSQLAPAALHDAVPSARPPAIEQLMPVPHSVQVLNEMPFRIHADFAVGISGELHPRLYAEATRFLRRLDGRTGSFFEQGFLSAADADPGASLHIRVKRPGKVELGEDESYRLTVKPSQVLLEAETDIGAIRGLETLLQMLDSDGESYYWQASVIEDAPRFAWRGLMIDSCRHFMPMDMIKRNLDGMASVKLNVMHWHLTEDQGFRIESRTFPRLHELGSDGLYYTHEQVREIIAFADQRGIRVVPEFDVPGHATAWLVGHPELGSAPGPYQIEREWGIFDPCLNPANPEVYVFLEKLFAEMTALFPDAYFHIGGDEVNGKHWNENPEIQAFMKANNIPNNYALQSYFNQHLLDILTRQGKKMIGWDEILQPDMPTDVVIHSWRGRDSMEAAARGGYASILSNGYYIDLIFPASEHYLNDPLPADTTLSQAEQKLILGGEATMWSEYVTDETVDSRIWPRTAAIAERLWSCGSVRDVESMYARLERMSWLLEDVGLRHRINRESMMRRLAQGENISPIVTLADAIEPLKHYRRYTYRKQTQLTPYTLLVDIARPDAPDARHFNRWVQALLEGGDHAVIPHLVGLMRKWIDNEAAYHALSAQAPVLQEGNGIATCLRELAEVASGAVAVLEGAQTRVQLVRAEEAARIFETARKPMAATEIQVVDAVEKLYKAASAE